MDIKKLEDALRDSWNEQTCHPDWQSRWTPEKASMGQCAVTSLVIQDYFGGTLVISREKRHIWNILPDGKDYDITRDQFPDFWEIKADGVIERQEMLYGERSAKALVLERYTLLKSRVESRLAEH